MKEVMNIFKWSLYLTVVILIICTFEGIEIIRDDIDDIKTQLNTSEIITTSTIESTEEITTEYLGQFEVTAYCHCEECCGKSDGITATGSTVTSNRTIAVDPDVIPLGSNVMIDGQIYIAEDIGGKIKGNKIDIYMSDHQQALNYGVQYKDISILNLEV